MAHERKEADEVERHLDEWMRRLDGPAMYDQERDPVGQAKETARQPGGIRRVGRGGRCFLPVGGRA